MFADRQVGQDSFTPLSPFARARAEAVTVAQPQAEGHGLGPQLFKQGSVATGFFVIKSGRVKVYKTSLNGKEQILRIFKAGENFAEVTTFDDQPFPASAAAIDPTELVFFPRLPFLNVLYQDPDIAINMLASLSQHLRHLTEVIEDLSFRDVPQRLAAYLLQMSEAQSGSWRNQPGPNPRVTLDLTKSQLAASLGTIPATLSRAFYRLSSEGLIAVNGADIELLDRERLQDLTLLTEADAP
ncbi:MAG: Crp/Fnr family transcriptional regulator [Leptolyngbyaceae cyanobacterium SM2_5_2]|nr:Crp/Fnr family transcriptional regulator [Leptolyngbyaceae cyanobacterium SM2_5_2]